MPRPFLKATRLRVIAALALAALAGLGAEAATGLGAETTAAPAAPEQRSAVALQPARPSADPHLGATLMTGAAEATPVSAQAGRERITAELVTLRPSGFDPAEISRAGGRFVLAVNNRSGVEGLTLRLGGGSGAKERVVNMGRRLRWRDRLNLPPGDYALTVAERPDWTCRITIVALP